MGGVIHDIILPDDIVPYHPKSDEENSPMVWDGPLGPVIVKRSDGKSLYTYHDLAFALEVGPTHYLTGHEQKEHFESLGFKNKHLPMGLVLGPDGKKLKSRTGDALPADEVLSLIQNKLDETPYPQELAWNIIAWNMLGTARETNIKFNVEHWIDPNAPGMYISYTYARVLSALGNSYCENKCHPEEQIDLQLLGTAGQSVYYYHQAKLNFDPVRIAHYAHQLAMLIANAYHQERINGGRPAFRYAISEAVRTLGQCMSSLTMFALATV